MLDWLHGLPFVWLVVVVFGVTYLVAAAISWVVLRLAVGARADEFKAVSPGLLPPLGVVFGLLVGFLAVQVWNDAGQAQTAVNREASALRSLVLLGGDFPGAPQASMRALVRRHIQETVNEEWPAMASQHATLTAVPAPLAEALRLALALKPHSEGQKVAQREMVVALETALDARRERIIVSESRVNWAKWTGVVLLAALTLLAIALVHSEKRATTVIANGIFASAVAVCLLMIASQDRPFAGPFAVKPDRLVQVTDGSGPSGALARSALSASRACAHVRTCHHCHMKVVPRCDALLRDGRRCERTIIEGSDFCVHHDRLLAQHGADALRKGLPRRKQARSSWQPTIVAVSADERAASSEGPASSDRPSADPSTVRPRLAEVAAESVEDIQRTLLDAATSASKPAWVEFECTDCGNRKRVEVPIPDVRARVAAIELLLREGLGRPGQAEEPPALPRMPETKAEIGALGWEELKALALAYPEAECLPEEKRTPWLYERWVGLTQADRDALRAALDAADAPPIKTTVA